jgi:hypothetical protein
MKRADIPVSTIRVGERRRTVDPYIVEDLRQSIQQSGLLHNIGVIEEAPDQYRLVFGAHRLEAVSELEWAEIPALVFPEGTSDEECLLMELQENMARNELTGAERKAFAAEVGRLILRMRDNSTDDCDSTVEEQWFVEFCEKSGISPAGGYKWWSAFCKDAGLNLTPKQANIEYRLDFFRWLDEQKAKDDAEKARKEEERAAEKARKEQEKALAKREGDFANARADLDALRMEYGVDAVLIGVIQPFLDRQENGL